MNHLSPGKTGLALGYLLGGIHFLWALIIAFGWAQSMINFVFWAHMLAIPVTVKPFDLTAAISLVIMTAVAGYVIGYAFAKIWNWCHK